MTDVAVTDRRGAPGFAAFRLLLRSLVTPARVISLTALSAVAVMLGITLRFNPGNEPTQTAFSAIVNGYCLALLVPVAALVFASAVLGDLAEDGTLVYLWLKPVARWRIVVAAYAATLCIALPVAVIPATVAAAVSDVGPAIVRGAAVSTALATIGYSSVFLGLGLIVQRALAWGLAYILIWEGAVSRVASGAARLSFQVYARSVLSHLADRPNPKYGTTTLTAIITVVAVSAVAIALTAARLARDDVP